MKDDIVLRVWVAGCIAEGTKCALGGEKERGNIEILSLVRSRKARGLCRVEYLRQVFIWHG